ncbi:Peptidoglycan-associated lipoprotein [Alphaproteobacteria bacterium SO-S41]|nr:Peptidoglycan-associated lipoprotein [Alphaproteobacteria bacterium SO-S41]
MNRFASLLFGLCVLASSALAVAPPAKTLPPYLTLPADVVIADDGNALYVEDFGEGTFYTPGTEEAVLKRGRHWTLTLIINGVADDTPGKALWEVLKPAFLANGWTVSEYDSNPFAVMLRYEKGGKDSWAYARVFGRDDIRFDIVEVGPPNLAFAVPAPAAKPEKVKDDSGDFPFIPPLPNSEFQASSRQDGPMSIQTNPDEEAQLVGTSYIVKSYSEPPFLSPLYFVVQYENALAKAGWTVLQRSAGSGQTDGTLTAHYLNDGRDIWAYLHDGGGGYTIQVADAGVHDDMAKTLKEECHVALYGVLFDFNKSTLKPESDGVLQRVFDLMQKEPDLRLEVQGHTDNVGSDEYNQTLSEARAQSVMDWLIVRGIAPDRLTSKGYGETIPVASNDDDAGRAKNRRVEIANQDCAN